MEGDQPTDDQKPPVENPNPTAMASGANGDSLTAKKRKKEALKPIITNEGPAAQQTPT